MTKTLKNIFKKSSFVADAYRIAREKKYLMREPRFCEALGYKFNGIPSMCDGSFEPNETRLFHKLISECDVFVNIGANTGYYCLKALQEGKDVIAFEPNETNTKILMKNLYANDFGGSINLFPIALSEDPGILPLYGSGTGASLIRGWAGQKTYNLVPVNSYDNLLGDRLDSSKCLVWVDVEGAEFSCLKGCGKLLENSENNIFFIEICVEEHQPVGISINPDLKSVFELFYSSGYVSYTAGSIVREVTIDEIEKIQFSKNNTLEVHNFIFIESSRKKSVVKNLT